MWREGGCAPRVRMEEGQRKLGLFTREIGRTAAAWKTRRKGRSRATEEEEGVVEGWGVEEERADREEGEGGRGGGVKI